MSISKSLYLLPMVLIGACAGTLRAQEVVATGSQPGGEHWNQATWTGGQWSDGEAPSSGKGYRTANYGIRTVDGSSSTFGGDYLRLESGGMLGLKQNYGNTATVNLILDGGTLASANGTTGGNQQMVSGNVEVVSDSFVNVSGTNRRRITLQSGVLSGVGNITINGKNIDDILQLASSLTSSHTGDWTVNGGRLVANRDDQIGDLARVTLSTAASYLDIRSDQRIGSLAGSGVVRSGTSGSRTFRVGGDDSNTTFSGRIENGSGTISLVKEGTGTLTLSGNSTYTGGTTIGTGSSDRGGVVIVASSTAFGTGTVTNQRGGELQLSGGMNVANTLVLSNDGLYNTYGIRNIGGDNTWSGQIRLTDGRGGSIIQVDDGTLTLAGEITAIRGNRWLRLQGPGNGEVSGVISNGSTSNLPVEIAGAGAWVFSAANTHSGTTSVSGGGTLRLTHGLALQSSTLATGGVVFDQSVTDNAFTLGGLSEGGSIALVNNAATPAPISLAVGNNNQNTTFTGQLTGAGSLVKVGSGELRLRGANEYQGETIVLDGRLFLGGDGGPSARRQLPVGTVVTVADGAELRINGLGGVGNNNEIVGGLQGEGVVTTTNGGTIARLTINNTDDYTFDGQINANNRLLILKDGPGTQVFTGNSNYAGNTFIGGGTLRIEHDNALGGTAGYTYVGTLNASGNGTDGKLELAGGITSAEPIRFYGNGASDARATRLVNAEGSNVLSGGISLHYGGGHYGISAAGDHLTITGDIARGSDQAPTGDRFLYLRGAAAGEISGNILGDGFNLALIKQDAGAWTLSGNNTYTGPTTVSAGTLLVNGTHTGTGAYTVNSGATLGGTGSIGGPTTIHDGAFLAPGESIGMLSFTDDLTWQPGSTLLWEFVNNDEAGEDYDSITGSSLVLPENESNKINLSILGLEGYRVEAGDSFTLFEGDVYQGSTLLDLGADVTDLFHITDNIGWWGTWEVSTGSLILTAVPEPGTWLLLLSALAGGLLVRRRRG